MVKRGINFVSLILFSVLTIALFSNFVSAACTGSMQCSYISDQYTCYQTYGGFCQVGSDGDCENRGASSDCSYLPQNLCTSAVNCYWTSTCNGPCCNGLNPASTSKICRMEVDYGCQSQLIKQRNITQHCNGAETATCSGAITQTFTFVSTSTWCRRLMEDRDCNCNLVGLSCTEGVFRPSASGCTTTYVGNIPVYNCPPFSCTNAGACAGNLDCSYVIEDLGEYGCYQTYGMVCSLGLDSSGEATCVNKGVGAECVDITDKTLCNYHVGCWWDYNAIPPSDPPSCQLGTSLNCAYCGNACTNSLPHCSASHTCTSCPSGVGNCDGVPTNGCETPLGTDDNCARCGDDCGTGYCDSSTKTCKIIVVCGDGKREGTEGCDDGDTTSGDGCSSTCTVELGWTCNTATPNVCTRLCGNGVINLAESCDGSNLNGQTCVSRGFDGGTLACASDCKSFIPTGCCDNACTLNARRCSGNGYQTCVTGSSGCTVWGSTTACSSYPNAPATCSGAGVCSASCTSSYEYCDGSATDGDGCECPLSGYHCSSGSCVADCTPKTCAQLGKECGVWADGCGTGGTVTCPTCNTGGGEQCISGTCTCTSEDDTTCYNNDVYYVDSCGDVETDNKKEECDKGGSSCYTYGCAGRACTSSYICDCTINGDCDDDNSCTTDTCSGGYCSYSQKSCGADGDSCCQSGCTYSTDSDCPPPSARCGDGDVNQAWEECDGSDLDGETCISQGYSGGTLRCSSCSFDVSSCTIACDLTDAYWSTTSTYDGNSVSLVAIGTPSCNGKTITFEVREDNAIGTTHVTDAASKTMSSGTATSSWIAIAPSPRDGYYFIATASDGDDIESDRMEVLENTGCFDGDCDAGAGEDCASCSDDCGTCCGDGDCNYGELCSTCEDDCGTCPPVVRCGDGTCNNGETCTTCDTDCGLCPGCGDGNCNSPEDCTNCDEDCGTCPVNCGDGNCDALTEDCDICPDDCGICVGCPDGTCNNGETCSTCAQDCGSCPSNCAINSAVWSVTSALEGNTVNLNLQGTDCDGETISFVVLENDGFGNADDTVIIDPSNIIYSSSSKSGTWVAEWQDDNEGVFGGQTNPPEYYFKVIINGLEKKVSSTADADMLKVYKEDVVCAGINYCLNYLTQIECNSDLCSVGDDSVPGDTSCGSFYNAETGCYDNTNCGCAWNSNLNLCEAKWDTDSTCGGEACVDDFLENDCWLMGDACKSDCTCENGYIATGSGDCEPAHVCNTGDECWLAGDKCTDACVCQTGNLPNGDGTCGNNNPDVCDTNNDCWLMGDKCTDACVCRPGYEPNGDGYCDPIHVCDTGDECWLAGDKCTDACVCQTGYDTNGDGTCGDGGTTTIRKRGTCLYTENSQDNCDDNFLIRSLEALWVWDETNSYNEIPSGESETNYIQDVQVGVYRYDPQRQSQGCVNIEDTFVCPASVQVSFFGVYQVIIVIAIIILIYIIVILRSRNKNKHSKHKLKKRKTK